ncbi:hypothetical protein HDE69_000816 [Pedobacter cryoconitis]|uniref:Uncharacterized protein n=1 Tax=Pedobacter cryoconitis TaxID=188932 RepID=A0A7W9DI41_9SPHI|nr:hypothetical protein [Pedobacter cryoconitis]MBB5647926.1 hypothetical protein [Pedobacter cryoconitis]
MFLLQEMVLPFFMSENIIRQADKSDFSKELCIRFLKNQHL